MSYPSDLDHCFPIDQLTEYKYSVEELEPWALLEVVKFDIEFRGILLSALSIVELALVTQIGQSDFPRKFNSFGSARRIFGTLPIRTQQRIATKLGFHNPKECRSTLMHLNYLRNRVAHHERSWNAKNKFSLPKLHAARIENGLPKYSDSFSIAGSLNVILMILDNLPEIYPFHAKVMSLIENCRLESNFLLKNMGFEVP